MTDFVVRLEMDGPIATPLLSGTLFGHLCWAYRARRGGDAALSSWLEELQESPFRLSDGFPRGWVPKPLLRPRPHQQKETLDQLDKKKSAKKLQLMPLETFLAIRGGIDEDRLAAGPDTAPATWVEQRSAHNTIHRLTGRTPDSGGLFFADEWWPDEKSRERDVYVSAAMDSSELEDLFNVVGEWGFGRDASVGRGRFRARVEREESGLLRNTGNRLMSLSHGILTPNMCEARYRIHPVYGKVGGILSMKHNPFKFPMILLKPGSTFAPTEPGPYGELVHSVHPELDFVRHNGWHLTAGFTEAC